MKVRSIENDDIVSLKRIVQIQLGDEESVEGEDQLENETDLVHLGGTYALDSKNRVWKLDRGVSAIMIGLSESGDAKRYRD